MAQAQARASRESGGGGRKRRGKKERDGRVSIGRGGFPKNVMRAVFCKNDKSSRFSLLPVEIKFTTRIYTQKKYNVFTVPIG